MFSSTFFPTPKPIIEKMLDGINLYRINKILEPSAGKGDILDYIVEKYNEGSYYSRDAIKKQLYCIEQNTELQNILKQKKYTLIDNDFLTHSSDYIYDLIIMNPPFDNGVKHLLKAWEISKGAEVRCLLNAETINNPYSEERKLLLNIIEQHEGEVINLGKCFQDAERVTDVEVVMIKLKNKNCNSQFDFKINGNSKETQYSFDDINRNQIARINAFENLEDRYNKVKEVLAKYISALNELEFYAEGLTNNTSISGMLENSKSQDNNQFYNNFVEKFRSACWDNLLRQTKINEVITQSVRDDFQKFQQQQGYMAFTAENMQDLFNTLMLSQGNIMERCVEEAFDLMTKYYDENREYAEGWKTNKSWKVTKKFILPNMRDSWGSKAYMNYTARDKVADIEKAMCFIAGKKYKDILKVEDLFYKDKDKQLGTWYESEFFRVKMFKKGTIHFEFKDEYIYTQFNILAAKQKNWIGNAA